MRGPEVTVRVWGDRRREQSRRHVAESWKPLVDAIRSASDRSTRWRRPPIRQFVEAAVAGNLYDAVELALQYMSVTNSRVTVITDLLNAAHLQSEDAWHIGNATAQDEYRVFRAVEAAAAALPGASMPRGVEPHDTILLATVWPEEHDLGLRLAASALTEAGFQVDLVTGIVADDLVARAGKIVGRVVGLSATMVDTRVRGELADVIDALHKLGKVVIAGGSSFRRFPPFAQQIGVDAVAADARMGVMTAGRLRTPERYPLDRLGHASRMVGAPY